MRRFLVLLVALLIPLQSSLAAVVSIAGMPKFGCEHALASMAHEAAAGTGAGMHAAVRCISSGAHGSVHGHSCPHIGGLAIAMTLPTVPADSSAATPPQVESASFKSIVLDVPSPPPTRLS